MPDYPIVDAHLHVYDPGRLSYPWMRDVPPLQSPHLPADFRAALGGVEVEAAVFVEVDAAAGPEARRGRVRRRRSPRRIR